MNKNIIGIIMFSIFLLSACTLPQDRINKDLERVGEENNLQTEENQFVGIIEKDPPKEYNPNGCGYCFTSDDNEFDCAILGTEDGMLIKDDLSEYLSKKVIIYGKKHEGAALIMCPVSIDVEKIELFE